ncbi:endolytic transglycosylase MltG [Planomonospora parontospora]|uniref:endolytic transglycosylase MltG n=1 Tax=Planomonospora parontospora TaxID=58119 RepID=UPI0016704FCD|nr:endolytic transglycosylase MltG [Planomonospora parontospora]GGL33947.1 hypothetical protein GCM10014719_38940 [Planomonospora parontospora subsp. antibiotica]GII17113.1 hypothetical protein Ppa05_38390 [Planomonospora parontospora subsp. antibiotica]
MNIEDLLRETLSDMAHEEQPPPPGRLLRSRRPSRRGPALAAAAAVAVLAAGAALVAGALPAPVADPPGVTGRGPDETRAETPRKPIVLTVRAGMRLSQVLRLLSDATGRPVAEFERAAEDGEALGLPAYAKGALEGFVFPAAYEFPAGSSPREILAAMVARFDRAAGDAGLVEGAGRIGRTPLEVLTVASIVQAEAVRAEDMPKIARVVYNRLDRTPPRKLELDSTVMYGLGKTGSTVSVEDLRSRSRYNTYVHPGLPPGPIGNPGAAAVEAALRPAPGPWLFFVTTDPGRRVMKFADSEAGFIKLVEESRRNWRTG